MVSLSKVFVGQFFSNLISKNLLIRQGKKMSNAGKNKNVVR